MKKKFKQFVDFRSVHKLLDEPLTLDELKELRRKNGTISVKVVVNLFDLIENDKEWLRIELSKRITGSSTGLSTNPTYRLAGRTTNDEVIIAVTGNVDNILAEEELI